MILGGLAQHPAASSVPIALAPPKINPIVVSNGNANFSFSATSGLHYQVQYKNDLNDTSWQTLGADLTASSSTVPVSDVITNLQRFYRVMQLN